MLLFLQMDSSILQKEVEFLLGARNILAYQRGNWALGCVWIHGASLTFVPGPVTLCQ